MPALFPSLLFPLLQHGDGVALAGVRLLAWEEGCEAFVVDVEPERGHTPSIAEDDGVDADVEEARRHYAAQMAFLDL